MAAEKLEPLILQTLALNPLHGYGIGQRIEQTSGGVFRVTLGSLYPPSSGSTATLPSTEALTGVISGAQKRSPGDGTASVLPDLAPALRRIPVALSRGIVG